MKMRKIYPGVLIALLMTIVLAIPVMAANGKSDVSVGGSAAAETIAAGQDGEDEDIGDSEITDVAMSQSALTLYTKDQNAQLKVTIEPDDANYDEIIWVSGDTDIATVTADAVDPSTAAIKASSNGKVKISATVMSGEESYPVECDVTVSLYNGFHKDPDSGEWCCYVNGEIDTSKTDVMKGTVNGKSGWWNVVNGKVVGNTVAKNANGWWYIDENGMVDFSYNGFAKNSNGSWYCENGKVTFSKNSVIKDSAGAIGTKGTWYYVVGSRVQTDYTGVADYKNSNGWWYIKNGKVDFSANTVAKNRNGWWYVTDGKVQFDFTGLANYKNANGWWYIKNGKVDFTHNGVDRNKNGWYCVKNGKVDFSYTGFASNSNGKWYIEKGNVTFNKNSVIKDSAGSIGTKGTWYYVVGSKVQTSFTGLADYSNANGWWYIKNGQVDFTHNGVDKNKNGWYYVVGGKVDFSYTGVSNYKNSNGWWYIKNGKVDFTFNGTASNKYGTWTVVNGKAQVVEKKVTVFAGESIMSGMDPGIYNGVSKLTIGGSSYVVAKQSINTTSFQSSSQFDGMTGVQKIAAYNPTRIYIMMGMNEVGWKSVSQFESDYSSLIKAIQKACPDADIVILPLSPVSKSKASTFPNIGSYNTRLKTIADKYGCHYYDYTSDFKDSDGYLKSEYSAGDGVHWTTKAYTKFAELISAYDATL